MIRIDNHYYIKQYNLYAYLIDLFPSITMAFDFRKLRSDYSGDAIRVLRTSDNTEQDFGFVANEVVGSDVLDFVGWNLWSYSEELQESVWTKTNLTVTTDSVVDPDGTTTGDVLFETTTNGAHSINRGRVVLAGEEYTISFWIKDEGRNFISLRCASNLSTNNVTQPLAWFDLSIGALISDNGLFRVAPTITSAPYGWYFITYGVIANTPATSTAIQLNLSTNGTTTSYVGDVTKGVAVWGLQITESNSVLAYDKTEATARGYGSISKGYDQASGGDDVINATIIRQPIIVNNGNLITDGGKLALQGGATLGLRSTSTVALSAYSDLFLTFGVNILNIPTVLNEILFETSSNANSNNGAFVITLTTFSAILVTHRISAGVFSQKSYPISAGRQLITVRFRTGQTTADASQVWINGVEVSGTVVLNNNTIALSNQVIYLFARAGNTSGFLGKYQNFTMFTDEAQKVGIETNINNYHGYY